MKDWKAVWQMVSGLHQNTPPDKVKAKLFELKDGLTDGLLQFKPSQGDSGQKLEKLLKAAKQEKLLPLTKILQKYLNLDAEQTWSTLCSYLINEYKGSPGSLASYVSNEANKWKLVVDIWNYYTLERMIILKLIKNLLEFHNDKRHPYHEAYAEIVEKIGLAVLKNQIIDQLTDALKDDPDTQQTGYGISDPHHEQNKRKMLWDRKLREINELVHDLVLIGKVETESGPEELKLLLNIFRNSAFLQKCKFNAAGESSELLQRIEQSKVVVILLYLSKTPADLKAWHVNTLKDTDELIRNSQQCPENGPIFLSWMIKNFKAPSQDEVQGDPRVYQNLGAKAIKLDVFNYLLALLQTKTFQSKPPNLLATTARRVIYDLLDDLCILFDGDGSVSQRNGIYDLLADLLTTPSLASDFMRKYSEDSTKGCVSLFNTSIELFPAVFVPLSKIAASLANSGTKNGSEFIKSQLQSLPVFTELFNGKQYDVQPIRSEDSEDEFLLTKDYYPMRQFSFKIPTGTRLVIMDRGSTTFSHFWKTTNYFQVLHNEIKELLLCGDSEESELFSRVSAGVAYLREMLKKMKDPSEITEAMVHPVELVFDVLLKFRSVPYPPIHLLANCLEMCAELSKFFDQDVLKRVIGIFPTVTNSGFTYEEYAKGTGFDSGLVGHYLINFESGNGSYPFLKAYFNFLSAYKATATAPNVVQVELPAVIFMLREIFPHCHTWRFERESELHDIYIFVMEYFFEVLQTEDSAGPEKKLLRDICVFGLLNLENGLTLLKFVGIGNPFLQSKMEGEPNWSTAINSGLNHIVQLSMTILMQILRKKSKLTDPNAALSPLETIIYTQPKQRDTLRIIPVVTRYMNNIFNKRLPILSCRLLRRFAIEFQMSLLACLDMEQDHIRMIFLQRLRDDTGGNELKIAILEFVEACLDKQPGLVEAFFDIRYDQEKKRPKMHTEGIPAYMEEYLEAISKDPEKVASPLLSRIMSLFHVVWRNNMQSLISKLIESDSFWPSLCTPLFMTINIRSLKVYSQLFNILGLEVFKYQNNELSPPLEKVLKKFLDLESFESWLKYLLNPGTEVATNSDETPEWLCRMQSFKDFICIVVKKKPQLMSSKARCHLLNRLIIEILKRIDEAQNSSTDSRAMVILTELYLLVLVNNGSPKYTESSGDHRLFQDVGQILSFLAGSYEEIIPRVRSAILGFTVQIVLAYHEEVALHSDIGSSFVQSTLAIICQELSWIESGVVADSQPSVALLLALQLLQKLLMINNKTRFFDWESVAVGHKILYRFLGSLQRTTQRYEDRKLTMALLETLTAVAGSLETNEFLFCDVGDYLWLKLLPPKVLLRDPFQRTELALKADDWTNQDWWPIYDAGIELVTVLLQKHGSLFVDQAIAFLGIHEEYLMDSINLVRESLEPRAMSLIGRTVGLICECTSYRKKWQLEHPQSISNLMRSIQILTEQLISLIYRPNLLKMLLENRPNDNGLVDLTAPIAATPELISALNGVIEIIISCVKALLVFSPPLMDLVCEPTFVPSQWHALIEIQFGAPKFNDTVQHLSFGTLLSAVGSFSKALGLSHFNFQEKASQTDTSTKNDTLQQSKKSVYNRTSSFGNQSLANCNEILSNLDGMTCMVALEHILTLILSQSYLAIKDTQLSHREKQLIKRELSAELCGLMNEFLKRKLGLENIGTCLRKKHGSTPILVNEDEPKKLDKQQPAQTSTAQPRRQSTPSMRVNVVRRLHLQQKVLPSMLGSTPNKEPGQSNVTFENITPIKRRDTDADIEYLDLEEPNCVGLSKVKIVDADYLHILSNLFAVVCHSEK